MNIPFPEKKELYKILLDTRNMEIKLFWQRSNYFLALNSAMAVGFFTQLGGTPIDNQWRELIFAVLGLIVSFLWLLVCLGGRFWQAKWEGSLKEFEYWQLIGVNFFSSSTKENRYDAKIGMDYHDQRRPDKRLFNLLALTKPSVSYAMILLSVVFIIGWLAILLLFLCEKKLWAFN